MNGHTSVVSVKDKIGDREYPLHASQTSVGVCCVLCWYVNTYTVILNPMAYKLIYKPSSLAPHVELSTEEMYS